MVRHLANPCFDIFMRALPFTLDATEAVAGTVLRVVIEGECGGVWYVNGMSGWRDGSSLKISQRQRPSVFIRTRFGS